MKKIALLKCDSLLILVLIALVSACLDSFASAGQAELKATKTENFRGEEMIFLFRNTGQRSLFLDDPPQWQIKDLCDNIVFASDPPTKKPSVRIKPQGHKLFRWRQVYFEGKPVPPGDYTFMLFVKGEKQPYMQFVKVLGTKSGSKKAFRNFSDVARLHGFLASSGPVLSIWAAGGPLGISYPLIIEAASLTLSYIGNLYAEDPPDQNFREPVTLIERQFQLPKPTTSFEEVVINYAQYSAGVFSTAQALKSSIEKYEGAIKEKDAEWTKIHAEEIKRYSKILSERLARLAKSSAIMAKTIAETDMKKSFSNQEISEFRKVIVENGLPKEEIELLRQLGLDDSAINRITSITAAIPSLPTYDLVKASDEVSKEAVEVGKAFNAISIFGLE